MANKILKKHAHILELLPDLIIGVGECAACVRVVGCVGRTVCPRGPREAMRALSPAPIPSPPHKLIHPRRPTPLPPQTRTA